MNLANILFIIVMLHLAIGFGYIFYKLEFKKKKKPENKQNSKKDD